MLGIYKIDSHNTLYKVIITIQYKQVANPREKSKDLPTDPSPRSAQDNNRVSGGDNAKNSVAFL